MKGLWLWLALLLGLAACDAPTEEPLSGEVHTCPMHPEILQVGFGDCPICGMDLVPRDGDAPVDDAVYVSADVVQSIGVRTEVLRRQPVFRHLRTIGEVEVGEDALSVVNSRTTGWVEKLYVDRTGDPVQQGQKLFELYSPEFVAAQEQWLALPESNPLAASSRRKLELWGVDSRDLDAVRSEGEARRTLPIRAPASGFVLSKDVVEGARVAEGQDLYRIGNLTRIWVQAEVYEHDAPWVEVGQKAQMELTHQRGQVLEGQVSYIYPTLDETSRTLTVRLEFENPGIRLKPGMFATVYVEYRRKDDVLAVPSAAILHSGTREVVFVSRGDGHFEPREVVTGLVGDRHLTEVLEGLKEGEEVVTSGQFLLDAESQLQEALARWAAGAEHVAHQHHEVMSCPMHPEVVQLEDGRCPDCGMDLEPRPATDEEWQALQPSSTAAYVCPMHPEETSEEAGRCGACGMFLEKAE